MVLEFVFVLWGYHEDLEEYRRYRDIIRSPRRPSRWSLFFELIGAALVAIGVAGELGIDIKSGEVQTGLRTKNGALVQLLEGVSNDALSAAAAANERSKRLDESNRQLGIDLEAEKQKTARFQKDADEARLALQMDLKAQGPRWRLLRDVAPKLAKDLAPYAAQRADLYVCGPRNSVDPETMSTWGAMATFLGGDGAKWKLGHGGLNFWDRCGPYQGITVYISSLASKATLEAANVLSTLLIKTLPPSSNRMLGPQDPELFDSLISKGLKVDGTAPYVLVARDPDLITVLIGAHPQQ